MEEQDSINRIVDQAIKVGVQTEQYRIMSGLIDIMGKVNIPPEVWKTVKPDSEISAPNI